MTIKPLHPFSLLAALATLALPALAVPKLRCELNLSNQTHILEAGPSSDPYLRHTVDVFDRFIFKAVVFGHDTIDYIKLYTYLPDGQQPLLMHQVTYLSPPAPTISAPVALPGRQSLYSPGWQHELQYQCALHEVAP